MYKHLSPNILAVILTCYLKFFLLFFLLSSSRDPLCLKWSLLKTEPEVGFLCKVRDLLREHSQKKRGRRKQIRAGEES